MSFILRVNTKKSPHLPKLSGFRAKGGVFVCCMARFEKTIAYFMRTLPASQA